MSDPGNGEGTGRHGPAREGTLDAQLSLTGLAEPIGAVVKRDGHQDPFDLRKIARAIEGAGHSSQEIDRDTSLSLASAVALYLASSDESRTSTDTDHVRRAVERVLREMGYDRTAQCFARHGERQRRAKGLRDESQGSGGGSVSIAPDVIPVERWDWERTLRELSSDAGLEESRALLVVKEVQRQVDAAGLRAVTPAAVRELVGLELVHEGLDTPRRPFGHLEISLHDAEHIISSPEDLDPTVTRSPEGSDRLLAARVKKEFALSKVYSPRVSAAHSRGDVFVHDLGAVDRLHGIAPSLERLKRFGIETEEGRRQSFAAKEPDTLVAQLTGQTTALRPYFSGPVTWEGLNFSLAPYAHQLDREGLRDLAKVLLYEFAFRSLSEGDTQNRTHFSLHWDVPQHMFGVELTGPGGALTERTCEDYVHTARDLALAIIDVNRSIAAKTVPVPTPSLAVRLTPYALERPEYAQCIDSVSRAIAAEVPIKILCDSDSPLLPHAGDLLSPVRVVAHRVTMNLPRAALRGRDEPGLFAELDRMVDRVLQGHLQKRALLERLVGKQGMGPLGLLASSRNGCPMVELSNATFVVGVLGLNECVQTLCGSRLHESSEAANFGEAILGHIRSQCEQWGEVLGMNVSMEPTLEAEVAAKFASADQKLFDSQTPNAIDRQQRERGPRYTAGAAAVDSAELAPLERVRLESRFHAYFHENAFCTLASFGSECGPEGVATFIRKAFVQTPCRGIAFH